MVKCIADLKRDLELKPDFSYVISYDIEYENNDILIVSVVEDGTTAKEALNFAEKLLKWINLNAKMQDDSISESSIGGYGTLYDYYNAKVAVANLSMGGSSDDWIINSKITTSEDTLELR